MDLNGLKKNLENNGQGHLIEFWDILTDDERETLYTDLTRINYPQVNRYFKDCQDQLTKVTEKVDDQLEPLSPDLLGSVTRTEPSKLKEYELKGLQEISDNHVGVILLAGGQGTRLGVPYPKGMYNVGLPSQKTLYQLQAERILKVQELAKKATGKAGIVPWCIMTSEHTMESTKTFFKNHNHFGLKPENVIFFDQHMLPCLTFEGKVILENTHKVARAPDGNGGLYKALGESGVLANLKERGVRYVHVYCVDNILVKMADPVFMGFCIEKGAPCGAKVVEKAFPTESVGVVCKVDGVYQVVEYSEITLKTAERRNSDGRLTFNAGNICNHFFTLEFIEEIVNSKGEELVHHIAKKKIPHLDSSGKVIKPESPNGIKMEKFVFDVFKFAKLLAVWEVLREDEFSPLKNADSAPKDTPTTSRCALYSLHRRHVINSGGKFVQKDGSVIPDIPRDAKQARADEMEDTIVCEISPLLSYAGEGLENIVSGKCFEPPLVLKAPGENGKESIQTTANY